MFSKTVILCGNLHKNMFMNGFTNALGRKFLCKFSVTINIIFYLYNLFYKNCCIQFNVTLYILTMPIWLHF